MKLLLAAALVAVVAGYFNEEPCRDMSGQCMPTSCCQGGNVNYVSGKCPTQPGDIKCCTSSNSCYNPYEEPCRSGGGQCAPTGCCQGSQYQSNLCPSQPFDIKCCSSSNTCTACPGCSTGSTCQYVSRSSWGARSASLSSMSNNVDLAFIHHTAGSTCTSQSSCSATIRGIQNYHMDTRGYSDIAYSFLVGGDGQIYEGRGFNKAGAHTKCYNSRSYGLAFMGDFSNGEDVPTFTMLNAAQNFLDCMKTQGKLSSGYKVYGHRDAKCSFTECPGQRLLDIVQGWPRYGQSNVKRNSRCGLC